MGSKVRPCLKANGREKNLSAGLDASLSAKERLGSRPEPTRYAFFASSEVSSTETMMGAYAASRCPSPGAVWSNG